MLRASLHITSFPPGAPFAPHVGMYVVSPSGTWVPQGAADCREMPATPLLAARTPGSFGSILILADTYRTDLFVLRLITSMCTMT